MNYLNFMLKYTPRVYWEENTTKSFRVFSEGLKSIETDMNKLYKNSILDSAELNGLENIFGANLQRPRKVLETAEEYRAILKAIIYSKQSVPTHDNILKVIKKVVGFYPILQPLHILGNIPENDHGYYIAYDLTNGFNNDILDELEKIIGAGVKIERDYFFNMEGITIYPACVMYDNEVIDIGCIPLEERENIELPITHIVTNIIYDEILMTIGGNK